jgi:hypothetical protein
LQQNKKNTKSNLEQKKKKKKTHVCIAVKWKNYMKMDVKNMVCERDVRKWYIQYHKKPGSAPKYLHTTHTRLISHGYKNNGELNDMLHFIRFIVKTV